MPPRPVPAGWLLRLRVENHGHPATFECQITPLGELPAGTQRSSWSLPWRNHEGASRAHLDRGQGELVRLALARTARPDPDLLLLSHDQDGRPEASFPATPDRSLLVSVRIRDSERDDIVAAECVSVSFRRYDLSPAVAFVSESTQGTRLPDRTAAMATESPRATGVPAPPRPASGPPPQEVVALDASPPRAAQSAPHHPV